MTTHRTAQTETHAADSLPPFLTLKQAADTLRLSRSTLRRRIASGELACLRTRPGSGGKLLLRREDIAAFVTRLAS